MPAAAKLKLPNWKPAEEVKPLPKVSRYRAVAVQLALLPALLEKSVAVAMALTVVVETLMGAVYLVEFVVRVDPLATRSGIADGHGCYRGAGPVRGGGNWMV